MVSANHAANNSQNQPSAPPKLTWYQWDILRYIEDDCGEGEGFVTVTPGRPPRAVQRAHDYFRTHKQIKPLVDLGLLAYLRAEIYPGGVCCDIYETTPAGKAAVEAYYADVHERDRSGSEARRARIEAQQKSNKRMILRAALLEQFGYDFHIPTLYEAIDASMTPFLNIPLPLIAPSSRDGGNITIREYLIILWYECLSDDMQAKISDLLKWGEVIGYEDAARMIRERGGDYSDDDDDDEPDGDLTSPYGRIS